MKFVLSVLLVIVSFGDLDRIAKINRLKKEAKQAYQLGNYGQAISKYHYLLDSMKVEDYRVRLNLANAYYQSDDLTNALNNYGLVTESNLNVVKSTAYQQMGVVEYEQKKYKESLDSFKQAIKTDPTNEQARYNYELLKKILKEEEQNSDQNQDDKNQDDKNQDDKNQDSKNQDSKNQDSKNQDSKNQDSKDKQDQQQQDQQGGKEDKEKKEGEEKDGKAKKEEEKEGEEKDEQQKQENMSSGAEDKLKEMKISEKKAKMILEALRNQEIQYIQQNRKKAKKRPKSNKPDW